MDLSGMIAVIKWPYRATGRTLRRIDAALSAAVVAVARFVLRSIDVILGIIGYAGAVTSLAFLFGIWWAMLAGSLALIALALVVPRWD